MKFTEWFDGQRITKAVLDWLNLSREEEIKERVEDTYQDGIVRNLLNNFTIIGKDGDPTLSSFFHVAVRTGVAYKNKERIVISNQTALYDATNVSDTTDNGLGVGILTPHSTGCFDIPLTSGSINYLYIAYLLATDETVFSSHKITRARQFYKRVNGYQIQVNTTGINPDSNQYLYLGQVDLTGINQAISSNISTTGRVEFGMLPDRALVQMPDLAKTDRTTSYSLGNKYFVDDHVKAVGSGTPSPTNPHGLTAADVGAIDTDLIEHHQKYLHSTGIVGDDTSTVSSLYPSIISVEVPTPLEGYDYILIRKLIPEEFLLLDGVLYDYTTIGSDSIVTFSPADPSGSTYYIYFDKATLTFQKTLTNLLVTPDPTKFLICTVTWTVPGDNGPIDGDLSNLVDRRVFGTTSNYLIQVVMALTLSVYATNTVLTYSPTENNLLTYSVSGVDGRGTPFSYTITNAYLPTDDDANAVLNTAVQTFSYDTSSLNVTSAYTYDGNGNLIAVVTA